MQDKIQAEDLNVLVVSSQASQRLIIKRFLEMRKHPVNLAENGLQMIEQDKAFACGLMVIDNTLTDMPITEALFTARENRRLMKDVANIEYCPVIILAGATEKLDELKLKKLGAISRLNKPLNLKELGKVINRIQDGEFNVQQDEKLTLGIMDPEKRASAYFKKLLTADDLTVNLLRDPVELSACIQDRSLNMLILETMALKTQDPSGYIRSIVEQNPKLQIMVCTAFNDDDEHDRMIKAGAKHVITKPVNPTQLRSLVRQMIAEIEI